MLNYRLDAERLRQLSSDEKLQIFNDETRACERGLRTLFQLAAQARLDQEAAAAAIPVLGSGIESRVAYKKAADEHYFETWYAPEIYADGIVTTLYGLNSSFGQRVCGLSERAVLNLKAGSILGGGRSFNEIICALRSHISHFHEHACTEKLEEAPRLAVPALEVLLTIASQSAFDSMMSYYALQQLSDGSFEKLMQHQYSVGPDMVRVAPLT
jgi:hypothetical protein